MENKEIIGKIGFIITLSIIIFGTFVIIMGISKNKHMKTKQELIDTIPIFESNLEHMISTGKINGSLLLGIERVMDEYAKQEVEKALNSQIKPIDLSTNYLNAK